MKTFSDMTVPYMCRESRVLHEFHTPHPHRQNFRVAPLVDLTPACDGAHRIDVLKYKLILMKT